MAEEARVTVELTREISKISWYAKKLATFRLNPGSVGVTFAIGTEVRSNDGRIIGVVSGVESSGTVTFTIQNQYDLISETLNFSMGSE